MIEIQHRHISAASAWAKKLLAEKPLRDSVTVAERRAYAQGLADQEKADPELLAVAEDVPEAILQSPVIHGNLNIACAMMVTEMERHGGFEEVLSRPAVVEAVQAARAYMVVSLGIETPKSNGCSHPWHDFPDGTTDPCPQCGLDPVGGAS